MERISLRQRVAVNLRMTIDRSMLALLAISLALAGYAQSLLDRGARMTSALVLYALAAILFLILLGGATIARGPSSSQAKRHTVRWWLIGAGLICGGVAFFRFEDNLFTLDGTTLWLVGLLLLAAAVWRPEWRPIRDRLDRIIGAPGVTFDWIRLGLIGAMLLGAFFRLFRIDRIPLEMGCDLPHIYNNIRLLLRREFLIFFPSHPGREALFFYMAAPFCRLFGLSHVTIKVSSALIGVATLPAVYLLAKELFDREVGLYAAFFLSISHWHIILTRVGFRSCTMPLMLTFMLYFLAKAFRGGHPALYVLAGVFLGLGLYTYNAFLVVPVLVLALFVVGLFAQRGRHLLVQGGGLLLCLVVAAYLFIPLGRYALANPTTYFYRVATRATGLEASLPADLVGTFIGNTIRALGMFNYRGDGVFVNNVPFSRELGYLTAVLFVLGGSHLVWRWRHGRNAMVLVSLMVMLLPTSLSLAFPHEVPNAGRAIGALVPAIILPAVALALIRRAVAHKLATEPATELRLSLRMDDRLQLQLRWPRSVLRSAFWVGLCVLALLFEARAVYPFYFQEYVAHLPSSNYAISLELARAIDDFSDDGESYIVTAPYWYDGNAVRAQLRRTDQSWHNELLGLNQGSPPFAGPSGKFMVILHPEDAVSLQLLQQMFPTGIALKHSDFDDKLAFVTYYGER